jgi:hypothetical protein
MLMGSLLVLATVAKAEQQVGHFAGDSRMLFVAVAGAMTNFKRFSRSTTTPADIVAHYDETFHSVSF